MALHHRPSCAACQTRDLVLGVGSPFYPRVTGRSGNVVEFDGAPYLLAGGNDYLDLATDPRVGQAAKDAVDGFGAGMTGSPLMNGHMALHEQLADELAAWTGKEAAMVFTAGYLANLGALSEICQMSTRVPVTAIRDESVHASLVDGLRLGRARIWKFRHNDMTALRAQLERAADKTDRILIVVDGVYSVEGDIAPLPEIVELARRYGAEIFLDDAHGFGVVARGHGTAVSHGVAAEVDYISATFSKSCGSSGGFVAATREIIDHLEARCSPHMFAASLPPAMAAATLTALRIMQEEPERCERALHVADVLRAELDGLGYRTGGVTPIIPVGMSGLFGAADVDGIEQARLKDTVGTFAAQRWLLDNGIYVNPFIPPGSTEPILRLSVSSAYTDKDIDKIVEAFRGLRERIPAMAASEGASACLTPGPP